ncbi:MAG: hypothetical protein WKF83_12455 [Nocardioidaceae bacterium]
MLRYWKVFDIEGLGGRGEQARTELAAFMETLEANAQRFEDRRDALKARLESRRASAWRPHVGTGGGRGVRVALHRAYRHLTEVASQVR